jgi:hypothetical protein
VSEVDDATTTLVHDEPPIVTVAPDANPVPVIVIAVPPLTVPDELETAETTGGVVLTAMACEPAILFAPPGTTVDVITLLAASAGALVNTYELTFKSLLVSPTPTVYVPVSVVDVDFVNTTVSPVSSVTVIDAPSATASLVVAVILMAVPTPYDPLAVVEENDKIVGLVVSIVRLNALDAAESIPLFVCFEVIDHTPSASVPRSQLDCAVAVNVHVTEVEPALVAVTVTVLPFETLPTETVGVLSEVTLSEDDEPESDPESKSGVAGVDGVAI